MASLKEARARVLKWLTRKGRSRPDAEDLIQEACLRLHEYCWTGHAVVNKEAFLNKVARRLSIDQYRAAQRHPSVDVAVEEIAQRLQIYAPGTQPDEVLDSEQRLENIRKELDARSIRMRQVFFAHRAGYSYKKIAAEFKISASSVEKDIARAVLIIMEMKDEQ